MLSPPVFCVVGLLLAQAVPPTSALSSEPPADAAGRIDEPLASILERLDRTTALYRDQALEFACDERIVYVDPANDRAVYDFDYIYVYDEARGFLDYRTLPHAGLRKGEAPANVDPAAYTLPAFVRRAYSWIFLFERAKWRMHRYALEAEESIRGARCFRIRLEPQIPYDHDINDWFATVWVDASSHRLVRIEAQKADHQARKAAFKRLASGLESIEGHSGDVFSFTEFATDFSVQKNGMAFPDTILIERKRCQVKSGGHKLTSACSTVYTVTQKYSNYQFFGTRTSEEIRSLLSGEPAAPLPPDSTTPRVDPAPP
jgi:hypothetical protein